MVLTTAPPGKQQLSVQNFASMVQNQGGEALVQVTKELGSKATMLECNF